MLFQLFVVAAAEAEITVLAVSDIIVIEFYLAELGAGEVFDGGLHDGIASLHVDHWQVFVVGLQHLGKDPFLRRVCEVTLQLRELHLRHHLRQLAAHGVDVLEVEVDHLGLHLAALLFHVQSVEELAEVVLQHLSVVASQRLWGFDSFHNISILAKYGAALRVAMATDAKPPGRFRYPTRYYPNGFNYSYMADTTNATSFGGIDVPHQYFSGAKIRHYFETAKYFRNFLNLEAQVALAFRARGQYLAGRRND